MSNNLYPSYGLSGSTKSRGISGTTVGGKNALDVHVVSTESANNFTSYESKSFTISGAQTNYNVKTAESMFGTVASSPNTTIYASVACTVKLNATGNSGIALLAGEEITITGYAVTNIFITTTADTDIRVVLFS